MPTPKALRYSKKFKLGEPTLSGEGSPRRNRGAIRGARDQACVLVLRMSGSSTVISYCTMFGRMHMLRHACLCVYAMQKRC